MNHVFVGSAMFFVWKFQDEHKGNKY
jgi:hypothetical protein